MNKLVFDFRALMCGLLLTFVAIGCGGNDNVTVFPVKGVVLFDGKPMVGGGSISFVPMASQEGKNAGGIIGSDGTFQMTTYTDGDGAMVGTFRVMIMQTVVQEPENLGDSDAAGVETNLEPIETVTAELQIPVIYADPVKSPATVTIEAKDSNELKIELSSQAAGEPVYGA